MRNIFFVFLMISSGWARAAITGMATPPGGAAGQLQYNNNGVEFDGVAGSTVIGQGVSFSGVITAPSFVGPLTGQASSVASGGVDFSTITAAIYSRPTGHALRNEGTLLPVVSSINFIGSSISAVQNGDQIDVTVEAVSDAIRSTATALGVNTTASTSWAPVPGSTMTLVLDSSNFLEIVYSCNLECVDYTQCGVAFSYLVDGSFFDGHTSGTSSAIKYLETRTATVGSPADLIINHKTSTKLSAGSRQISLLWASTGGVDIRMGRNMKSCSLIYKESPEQFNAGAASVASGATNLGAQSQGSIQSLVCSVLPCQAQGTFGSYDLWVATGTGAGQWMNARTGTGP